MMIWSGNIMFSVPDIRLAVKVYLGIYIVCITNRLYIGFVDFQYGRSSIRAFDPNTTTSRAVPLCYVPFL